jgi:AcrR family transcriptional regulator
MARPKSISDGDILLIAKNHFLRDGFRASTTAMATDAGVSEATIFKRFSTKKELFHQAMGLPTSHAMDSVEARIGQGNVQEHMVEIGTDLLEFFVKLVPQLACVSGVPGFDIRDMVTPDEPAPPVVLFRSLTDYLDAEIALGRIVGRDSEVIARAFMGALYNFAFFQYMGFHSRQRMERDRYVRELVQMIWNGIDPEHGVVV